MDYDIKSCTYEELKDFVINENLPSYRADQLYDWIQKKGVMNYDEMLNIPKNIRVLLESKYPIRKCSLELKRESQIDETVKYLVRLDDGCFVESVLMKYKYGYSACVSSQVGCKMGCSFCASTRSGCVRSLYPSEILGQIHLIQNDLNIRISHIVMMGMGEPFDNYFNTVRFIQLANSPNGLNISQRNISISTCGLVDKIDTFSLLNFQVTLSISLHAPNNELRNMIMPVNKRFPVESLIESCRRYVRNTSRRVSFEYALISEFNDSDECAYQLAALLKGLLCHVNLIPVNKIKETDYIKSPDFKIERFRKILLKNGINTTVRRTLGSDIDASCGQLRNNYLKKIEE